MHEMIYENGCKVDITSKNTYSHCNVNLTFGGYMKNRIKELREQRGLTQEQLGELVGVSRQAINAIETENGAALAANQVGILKRFPNRFVKTIRPQKVTIQALNEYGEEIIVDGEDEMAKCFCHELEHLDGMIFLDKAIEELSAL